MSLKNVISGCPGLQFSFEGGGGWKFFVYLTLVWLLNIPLFIVVPLLVGILGGILLPYAVIFYLFYALTICGSGRHYYRLSYSKQFALRLVVICIGFPFVLIVIQLVYAACLYLSLALCVGVCAIVAALLVAIVSPLITLFIPYYMLRISILTIRGLK